MSLIATQAYSSEDTINFVNTKGNIKEIVVKDSISDAIDADFSELTFEKILIKN